MAGGGGWGRRVGAGAGWRSRGGRMGGASTFLTCRVGAMRPQSQSPSSRCMQCTTQQRCRPLRPSLPPSPLATSLCCCLAPSSRPSPLQAPSFGRRDTLLRLQEAAQRKWEDAKVFEVDAPEEGEWGGRGWWGGGGPKQEG